MQLLSRILPLYQQIGLINLSITKPQANRWIKSIVIITILFSCSRYEIYAVVFFKTLPNKYKLCHSKKDSKKIENQQTKHLINHVNYHRPSYFKGSV